MLLRTQPDERLVAMSRDGGRAAVDEIVRRHAPALTAFAGSIAPPSRAEDVVQESLLKAYVALQEGAEPELLRAWLFRIVRNTAIDEQRGTRNHEQIDENYDGVEQPPQTFERREQLAALMLAIHDLPAAQRDAIVQRELEGRGHEEIARALSLSPGAVRQLIYRARHSLRSAAGAMVPAGLVRAALMPGADQAVGGLGAAGALKLGLAVVATSAIVAGTSIERGPDHGTAEALQISHPQRDQGTAISEHAGAGGSSERAGRRDGEDSGSGSSGSNSSGKGKSGGPGPSEGSDHSGSGESGSSNLGDDGSSSNSGPGSGSSGESQPTDDSITVVSGDGGGGGGGSSGEGSGTDGGQTLTTTDGSGSSGPG